MVVVGVVVVVVAVVVVVVDDFRFCWGRQNICRLGMK